MSIHTSLKGASTLTRHRNVLTKSERLERLLGNGKLDRDELHVLGPAQDEQPQALRRQEDAQEA